MYVLVSFIMTSHFLQQPLIPLDNHARQWRRPNTAKQKVFLLSCSLPTLAGTIEASQSYVMRYNRAVVAGAL